MSTPDIIIWVFITPIVIILFIALTAWIFSIVFKTKEKIKRQDIQIQLLYKIAEQAGVNKQELKVIVHEVMAIY